MTTPRYISDLAGTQRPSFRVALAGTSGPPTTGVHLAGEIYKDSGGNQWNCIVSGEPGTWDGGKVDLLASLNVLDSVDIAQFRTTKWSFTAVKGSTVLILEIVASHDGTDPSDVRPASMQIGAGPVDLTVDIDISAGRLRLTATPATSGWAAAWRRLYATVA